MLDQFEHLDQIKFSFTSDVPSSKFRGKVGDSESVSVVVSTTKQDDGEIVNTPVSDVLAMEPMEKAAKLSRRIQEIRDQQYQFIAIAWIVLPCFCYFLLCPEVVWFDVTSHSNNKGFMLLTFSCRASLDQQVVFMWMWIPNEQ